MTKKLEEQDKTYDRDSWSGRTFPELSAATKAKISESSSKKQPKSQTKPFLFLDLRTENGRTPDVSWRTDGVSHGEFSTLNFGESPSVAVESRLSQILEDDAPPKYYLSPRACQGILRRAEKRGKKLPEVLEQALIRQSQPRMEQREETA